MKGKVFLDTNIFVYSIDSSPGQKKKSQIARDLVKEHVRNDSGVISIQVLQEFYHVSTQKIQVPISPEDALEYLNYIAILETVHPDFDLLVTAIRLHQKHRLSFWMPSFSRLQRLPAASRSSLKTFKTVFELRI